MKIKSFRRRRYNSFSALWQDLRWPFQHRVQLRRALRGNYVTHPFRERLMLTVTAVNQCRYCATFHTQESLKAGISNAEIDWLLAGTVAGAPAAELPALRYAQHWAESDGRPDPGAQQTLLAIYGAAQSEAIETVLQLIRTGNLLGNTGDWLLYRLSWGRLGAGQD